SGGMATDRRSLADACGRWPYRARLRGHAAAASGIAGGRRARRDPAWQRAAQGGRTGRGQLRFLVRRADRPVAASVGPGMAQRAVRDRLRRARRRGWAGRRRHGCARRALARLACAACELPDGRPAAAGPRTARALPRGCRRSTPAAGTVSGRRRRPRRRRSVHVGGSRVMADGPAIAAIVVSYQSAATIDECLSRLRAAHRVHQIRIVDNGSTDGTLALVQRHASLDPRLYFIANPDNPGFSVACNQGARDRDAAWLAFVNPDCLLDPDTPSRLRDHATALAGNCLLGADRVDEHDQRDAAARRRDPAFAAMLHDRAARDLAVPPDDSLAVQAVDAVSGALMLMPRAMFDRIGGFDTGYRLHAEDLDLCRRARVAGGMVAVANYVLVLPLRGVSSRSRPLFVEWHKHRGLWRYFRKFDAAQVAWPARVAVWSAIWLRFPLAALRQLARA